MDQGLGDACTSPRCRSDSRRKGLSLWRPNAIRIVIRRRGMELLVCVQRRNGRVAKSQGNHPGPAREPAQAVSNAFQGDQKDADHEIWRHSRKHDALSCLAAGSPCSLCNQQTLRLAPLNMVEISTESKDAGSSETMRMPPLPHCSGKPSHGLA